MARQPSFNSRRFQATWEHILRLPVVPGRSWINDVASVARDQKISMAHVASMMARLRKLQETGREPSGIWYEDRRELPARLP